MFRGTAADDVSGKTPRGSVARLDLTAFRNYASLRLDVDPTPIVLTGPNGAGKTNLLEALSLLVPGRGLRRAPLAEIVHRPAEASPASPAPPAWAVSARIRRAGTDVRLGTGYDRATGPARRAVRIDQEAKSLAALAEHVSAVWLTPEMDRLFLDSASMRRSFVDRLVFGFHPEHASRLTAYDQARRERIKLLTERTRDDAWLAAVEERLAALGVAIAAARGETVAGLDASLRLSDGGFPRLRLGMAGEVDDWLGDGPALAAEDRLREALAENRRADSEAGRTLRGPHRSDLGATHVGHGYPIGMCSTGEQKAALISVMLAYAERLAQARGQTPLLLFDEIAAHLDGGHRAELFRRILDMGIQAWMTGTEVAIFRELRGRAQFFTVVHATIRQQESYK